MSESLIAGAAKKRVLRPAVYLSLSDGRGVRVYRGSFRWNRWRGDVGAGREGDGFGRSRSLWMGQWPFGVIHFTGRWRRGA